MRRLRVASALTAAAALAFAVLSALARRRLYRVAVAGASMSPELAPGDFLLVRRGPPRAGAEAYGRLAVTTDAQGRTLIKRIVGLPGESLRVGSVVQVNERVLIEPYAHGETPPHQYRGLNRLGDEEYFLLGDNRAASTDSRDFGPVRREHLQGVAWLRYWPPGRVGRLRPPPRRLGERRPGAESELPEDHRDDPAVAGDGPR